MRLRLLPPSSRAAARRARALVPVALLVLLSAAPLAAYTVFLKNGTSLVAKEKYKMQNGKAIIVLQNGTQTSLDAAEIDVARTEEFNKTYGFNATVLEKDPAAAAVDPRIGHERRLSDLIASRGAAPRDLPEARRRPSPADSAAGPAAGKAGFVDLSQWPQKPFANLEVAADLQQFFHLQGFDAVTVSTGTRADRPLASVLANSEGSVFQALTVGANALLHLRDRFPGKVAALELVMTTPGRERAGQFVLTPELAADLVAKRVDTTAFFVDHVQF
jgi:hypothetical protein